jgi:NADH dehydrogenase
MADRGLHVVTGAFGDTGKYIPPLTGDVMVTREEIRGLMAELLYVDSPPAGETKLSEWAMQHADRLGRQHTSELARRENRTEA